MKEEKVIIPFNELEGYRINEKLEENKLSKLINKRRTEGTLKATTKETVEKNEKFKELLYTIYQPKNMVSSKGVLWNDKLVQQVFLSSDYMTTVVGSNEDALELKILEANRPEDYGLYYLQRGGIAEIIGTNLLLSKGGLFTLLSLADNKRYKKALSFLMHGVEDKEVTVKELQNISQENIAFKDPRWFGGFFVGELKETNQNSIEKGLKELEKIGFLKVNKDKVEIEEEGEILLSLLERRQVILSYENYYLESNIKINGEKIYFIKTDNALFLIQEVDGIYNFTSIDIDIAKEVLETIFQVVDIIEETNTSLVTDETDDLIAEDKELIDDKLPIEEPKKKYCYKCGNEISGTGKFCRYCGADVSNSD